MTKPLIGIIIQGNKGTFTPMIGHEVDTGDGPEETIFTIVGKQDPQPTLEAAQQFLIDELAIDERMLVPATSHQCSMMGIIWLDPIRKLQA